MVLAPIGARARPENTGASGCNVPNIPSPVIHNERHVWVFFFLLIDDIRLVFVANRGPLPYQFMRMPGVEPGSQAWEACMMPLHYMRSAYLLVACL